MTKVGEAFALAKPANSTLIVYKLVPDYFPSVILILARALDRGR